jgi:hypothetical protein
MQQPAAPERTPLSSAPQSDWSIVNSANQNGGTSNVLYGITCATASDCWAVGYYNNENDVPQTLIEHWDGTSWNIVSSPNVSATQTHYLSGVTCASASDCWAVGYYGAGSTYQTLIERWDGVSWAIVTSPNPSQNNNLFGVTCVSASNCWAVGGYVAGSTAQTLIEHWDGTSWITFTSPNTSTAQYNILFSLTCRSATDCWAVGNYTGTNANQTLIERWDGASWLIISSPNTSATQANYLSGVTCVSATADCWAIGYYAGGNAEQTLIERWDGTSWTIVSSPNTSTTQRNFIQALTCASASECWASGYYYNGSAWQTLIERWDGTSWAIATSPNTSATQGNFLIAVTCASASNCWTIGFYGGQTLVEHWDGSSWTIVTSPNAHILRGNALAVTCVSATDCWAVGYYLADSAYQTLIEHWDGTAWSIVTSPNTSATQSNVLYNVTCAAASECWAVGHYYTGTAWQTLIERWDGSAWIIVSSPNTTAVQNNFLYGVACASASDCWAVGDDIFNPTIKTYATLIEHWDGATWAIVISPNTLTAEGNVLVAVACVSASNCWAVGYYLDPTNSAWQTLIERWDGTSWTIVSSPSTSAAQTNFLNGVACTSTSNCWAIGYYYAAGSFANTLIERWDGTSWAIVGSPNATATQNNLLYGVTCTPTSTCWAVGYFGGGKTLVLRYPALAPPTPTSVVSRKTHGTTGPFDIDLPLVGPPGIECRSGDGSGDYQMVLSFPTAVTFSGAALTAGTGNVSSTSGSGTNQVTVNLTGVTNAQTIAVTLIGVNNGPTTGNVSISMGVLLGDVSSNGIVSNTDVGLVKAQVAAPVDSSNFRDDVNANGIISNTDVAATKAQVGTSLH